MLYLNLVVMGTMSCCLLLVVYQQAREKSQKTSLYDAQSDLSRQAKTSLAEEAISTRCPKALSQVSYTRETLRK
jgi:hypothetical protein